MANDTEQKGSGETVRVYANLDAPLPDPGKLTDLLSLTGVKVGGGLYGSHNVLSELAVAKSKEAELIAGLKDLGVPFHADSENGPSLSRFRRAAVASRPTPEGGV